MKVTFRRQWSDTLKDDFYHGFNPYAFLILSLHISCLFEDVNSFCLCARGLYLAQSQLCVLFLRLWHPTGVYLFDETEETPADKWTSASPLCTSLGNTAAGCKAGRFRDGSHHLPGCSRMREKSCGQSQDDSVISHLSQLWEEKMLNKKSLKLGAWNIGFHAFKSVTNCPDGSYISVLLSNSSHPPCRGWELRILNAWSNWEYQTFSI